MMSTGTILALKGDSKININNAITAGCCCYPDTPSCYTSDDIESTSDARHHRVYSVTSDVTMSDGYWFAFLFQPRLANTEI